MRLLVCYPLLLCASVAGGEDQQPDTAIKLVGQLQNKKLDEASGLARSGRNEQRLWAINDDGDPLLYGIDHSGGKMGKIMINGANNRDWEDLAAFSYNGQPHIVVADIGDNRASRDFVTLYVIEEPEADARKVNIAWQINFTYPDGARDAESLAVDASAEQIYVLSKRDIPAVLYRLPLLPGNADPVIAERLSEVDSLPQPSERQQQNAAGSGWGWQPTAMDFAPDGRSALILTYAGLYLYSRDEQQTWVDALNSPPLQLKLGKIKNAESIAMTATGNSAFLTVEKKHAPLFAIDLTR